MPPSLMIPGLPELWSETLGDPRVVVAVLDGPVNRGHPSLAGDRLDVIEATTSAAPDRRAPPRGTARRWRA